MIPQQINKKVHNFHQYRGNIRIKINYWMDWG